ncbi:lipopolysaccharide assembly protein LapA domain-containing protein [Blastococcus sp. TF02A-30]|uniref:lipopolysaccharide assembly protein LapA domain-containing protein n=1 Tax=Blastococcus sp. TF02A-30 TaxID=2250580 RepID=UPI000DE9A15C|nr:lipopolysaccharide assembly protein LapA domain-containing protein [Blastococcus sp. TF02A-30]RBY92864.1 LapA family protein [Blastococcus sp. TF02A-30]
MTGPDPRRADPLDVGLGGTPPPPASAPGPVEPAAGTTPRRERHTGRTIGRSLALALLLFATVVLVLFVVFNTQTVDISLVFGNVDAPLVVALLIAAALGAAIGWLTSLVLRARRRGRG